MAWDADWNNLANASVTQIDPYIEDLEYALHERYSVFRNTVGGDQPLLVSYDKNERLLTYFNEFETAFSFISSTSTALNAPPSLPTPRKLYGWLKPDIPFPSSRIETSEYTHPYYFRSDYLDVTNQNDLLTPINNYLSHQVVKDILQQRKTIFDLMLRRWYPVDFSYQEGGDNCLERSIIPSQSIDTSISTTDADANPVLTQGKQMMFLIPFQPAKEIRHFGTSCENNMVFNILFESYPGFPAPSSFSIDFLTHQRNEEGHTNISFVGDNKSSPNLIQTVSVSGSIPETVTSTVMGGGAINWAGIPDPTTAVVGKAGNIFGETLEHYYPGVIVDFDVVNGFEKTLNAL